MPEGRTRRRRRPPWLAPVAFVAALLGVPVGGALVWHASEAAFNGTTANQASSWAAGRVTLTDDDGGSTALFSATGLKPGSTGQKCIRVSYGGNVASGDVRLYSAAPTGSLGPHINLTVELGTVGSFAGCGGFAPASTPIATSPLPTVGSRTDYATGHSTGWNPAVGESRVFRFTYTVSTSIPDSLEGATCSMPFTWETQTA